MDIGSCKSEKIAPDGRRRQMFYDTSVFVKLS